MAFANTAGGTLVVGVEDKSRQTASRDLDALVEKGVVERRGRGRGTRYVLAGRMPRK